jgi:hypothetical protein
MTIIMPTGNMKKLNVSLATPMITAPNIMNIDATIVCPQPTELFFLGLGL